MSDQQGPQYHPSDVDSKQFRIELDLVYLKAVYVDYRGPETPSWAILEPRMRKYLEHVYSKE